MTTMVSREWHPARKELSNRRRTDASAHIKAITAGVDGCTTRVLTCTVRVLIFVLFVSTITAAAAAATTTAAGAVLRLQ
jgi:hypothetical protein